MLRHIIGTVYELTPYIIVPVEGDGDLAPSPFSWWLKRNNPRLYRGKSTLMIFDRHANLKYKYESRHFWCRGYYVDTVGKNKKAIEEYIRNQLVEDEMMDQMTMKEYMDPFTGSKNSKA